ncbi:hypothetical protein EYF80_054057 [Liparis tanakae]|uniref:Uncharacterized protein n=1 Tax=Liparis tanakae TaxID=230148 RepID=A0A4Z2F4F6_9TELE|nr:hypothetical protein EYF80_054057 [Liparis tanakae]
MSISVNVSGTTFPSSINLWTGGAPSLKGTSGPVSSGAILKLIDCLRLPAAAAAVATAAMAAAAVSLVLG